MKIQDIKSAPKVPFDLDGRIMFSNEPIEMIHLKLSPGESLDVHKNPFDVVFYVLSGTGIMSCEGISQSFSPYVSIEVKSTEMRGWKNESKENLELLVIKILN